MSVLIWLAPPVAAVLLGSVWVWWRARPPKPQDAADSVAAYERFRSALQHAEQRPGGR